MNSNHTTLVIWINPKFGGRFVLSGDGIFWDTWIPRGLRLHFCPWSGSHLSPRAVNFMSWYVGLLLSISRMTVNSLCHAAGMFTGKFSFACVWHKLFQTPKKILWMTFSMSNKLLQCTQCVWGCDGMGWLGWEIIWGSSSSWKFCKNDFRPSSKSRSVFFRLVAALAAPAPPLNAFKSTSTPWCTIVYGKFPVAMRIHCTGLCCWHLWRGRQIQRCCLHLLFWT